MQYSAFDAARATASDAINTWQTWSDAHCAPAREGFGLLCYGIGWLAGAANARAQTHWHTYGPVYRTIALWAIALATLHIRAQLGRPGADAECTALATAIARHGLATLRQQIRPTKSDTVADLGASTNPAPLPPSPPAGGAPAPQTDIASLGIRELRALAKGRIPRAARLSKAQLLAALSAA